MYEITDLTTEDIYLIRDALEVFLSTNQDLRRADRAERLLCEIDNWRMTIGEKDD